MDHLSVRHNQERMDQKNSKNKFKHWWRDVAIRPDLGFTVRLLLGLTCTVTPAIADGSEGPPFFFSFFHKKTMFSFFSFFSFFHFFHVFSFFKFFRFKKTSFFVIFPSPLPPLSPSAPRAPPKTPLFLIKILSSRHESG